MAMILAADGNNHLDGTTVGTTLTDLQKAVGGYIELVYLPNSDKLLVVDEEGLMKDYPINQEASLLARQPIVGDVVVANRDEIS